MKIFYGLAGIGAIAMIPLYGYMRQEWQSQYVEVARIPYSGNTEHILGEKRLPCEWGSLNLMLSVSGPRNEAEKIRAAIREYTTRKHVSGINWNP
jgi:hypothetical protein